MNKGKKYNKQKLDYESCISEIRYMKPEESVCGECGRKLVKASEKVRCVVEIIPSSIKIIQKKY